MRSQVFKSAYQAPTSEQNEDPEEVLNNSQYAETKEPIISAYQHFMKTELSENEKIEVAQMRPCVKFLLAGMCHQANVCVCCARFITETREIGWINKTILLVHEKWLQDVDIYVPLQNCYNVLDPGLQHCLLSPRARVN